MIRRETLYGRLLSLFLVLQTKMFSEQDSVLLISQWILLSDIIVYFSQVRSADVFLDICFEQKSKFADCFDAAFSKQYDISNILERTVKLTMQTN